MLFSLHVSVIGLDWQTLLLKVLVNVADELSGFILISRSVEMAEQLYGARLCQLVARPA